MGRYLDIIEAESTNRQYDKSDQNDKSHLTPAPEHETVCNFTTKGIGIGPQALPPEAKARRFKVTLTSGKVLLHSRPGGLTRQEAVELSKSWGEVAEYVPVFTPLEVSKPVSLDLTLAAATAGLPITGEQFRFFPSQDDLADSPPGLSRWSASALMPSASQSGYL
jgi:hypothetical protein